MHLQSWQVHGFGHFTDQRFDALGEGLTLFYGPNEAGKSTLLTFLKTMIFGWPKRLGRIQALNGGRHAGVVDFSHQGAQWKLERDFANNKAVLQGPHGPEDMARVLSGLDLATFEAVFAFNLQELGALSAMSDEGVRDRLFAGSLVGGGESLTAAMAQLEQRMFKLWKPRASECDWRRLEVQIQLLKERIQEAKLALPRYLEAEQEVREAQEAASVMAYELQALQEDRASLQLLNRLWMPYLSATRAESALATLPPLPEGWAVQADRIQQLAPKLEEQARRLSELEGDLHALQARIASLHTEPKWLAQGLKVKAMVARLGEAQAAWSRAQGKRQELDALRLALKRELASISPNWDVQRLESQSWGASEAERLRGARHLWHKALAACEEHEAESQALAQRLQQLREATERGALAQDASPQGLPSDADWARLEALRKSWERLKTQAEALDQQMASVESTLAAQKGSVGPKGLPPWLLPLVAGVLLVAGLLCLVLSEWVGAGAFLVSAVVVLGVAFAQRGPSAEGGAEAILVKLQAQRDQVGAHLDSVGQEWNSLASVWALGADPLASTWDALRLKREQALRVVLQSAESQESQREQMSLLVQQEASRREQAVPLRAAAEAAEGAWREALAHWALPTITSLDGLEELLRRIDKVKDQHLALKQGELSLVQDEAAAKAFQEDLVVLSEALGEPSQSEAAAWGTLLEAWQKQVDEAGVAKAQAETWAQQLQELLATQSQALSLHEATQLQLGEACRMLGLEGAEALPAWREQAERAEAHRRELAQWAQLLDAEVGLGEARSKLLADLAVAEPASWPEDLVRLEAQEKQGSEAREALLQKAGAAAERAKKCLGDQQLHALELERAGLESEQAEVVARWEALALAKALLEETLKRFERERQPEVLKVASGHFAEVTRGVYPRVLVRQRELVVVDALEGEREAAQLSQGTKEQLYLCLRLALSEALSKTGQAFPFVMDDVLVNFDAERAQDVARLLLKVAAKQQVLLFTCQEATVRLFQALQPDVVVKHLPRYGGRDRPAVPALAAKAVVGDEPRQSAPRGEREGVGEALTLVLDYLKTEARPLGKGAILEGCGLDERLWQPLSTLLGEEPGVLAEGDKRGRTYAWNPS